MPKQASNTPTAPPTCSICGKVLKTPSAIKAGMGKLCAHNSTVKNAQQWQQHYAKITAATVPSGYIKLATFKQIVPANKAKIAGLTIPKLVKAIGGDKAAGKIAHPIMQVVYVNNVRYINQWAGTQAGLTAIATGNYSNAPKAGK